ncbi:MAG: CHAT domain-containing protein [Scytolyngbya sp. HA4215-MV1]|jgi:CHAT domain-containing protein|nr:CHAT domain-containing protein [Scytolyngbya sp. HA4215-MV1]
MKGKSKIYYLILAFATAILCMFLSGAPWRKVVQASAIAQSVNAVAPEDKGKDLYNQGHYAAAITLLQQALQTYRQQGDRLRQAMTLSNLSLTYQQTGQWREAEQTIDESLQLIRSQESGVKSQESENAAALSVLAQSLDIQGKLQLALGRSEQALETWQQAATLYAQLKAPDREARSRINQAQALRSLGLYQRSLKTLTDLQQSLQTQPDSLTQAISLRALGDALQRVGDFDQATQALEKSLAIARQFNSAPDLYQAKFSLGNTARARAAVLVNSQESDDQATATTSTQTALALYQEVAANAPSTLLKVQATLNHISLLLDLDRDSDAKDLLPPVRSQIENLPPSRSSIYARINFAQSLMKLEKRSSGLKSQKSGTKNQKPPNFPISLSPYPHLSPLFTEASQLLILATQQAEQLGDQQAASYAFGILGELYEFQEPEKAQQLTERALILAQTVNASDIAYRWQWQLGRLYKAEGQTQKAIVAYDAAISTLQSIRGDLVANKDVQASFREGVEPVYRQSVELLLTSTLNPSKETLEKARQRIDSLQLAELDNFFREACLNAQTVLLDKVVDQDNPTTAIIYPIILSNKLQVIVKIPQQDLRYYTAHLSSDENAPMGKQVNLIPKIKGQASEAIDEQNVEEVVQELREKIIQPSEEIRVKALSQQIYHWLIQPIAADLEKSGVKTLVFVPDGALRSVPMAVLYDGEQYLVEKYAVALNIGLHLFDPKPLTRGQLKVLAAGVVNPPAGYDFQPLPAIPTEFNLIRAAGVNTTELLGFTRQSLEQEFNAAPFNVVHLATHGKFSSQAKNTFILAADGPINVTEFDKLLRSRGEVRTEAVELLVLSACQTATGDNRATLGLAGVATRAGARSTIASLWQVDDQATAELIGAFYRELKNPKVTKAEALRNAQLSLIDGTDYQDPGFWAPFVLVGNWL